MARNLSVDYDTVKSWHRTTGRAAKRWRAGTGSQADPLEARAHRLAESPEGDLIADEMSVRHLLGL